MNLIANAETDNDYVINHLIKDSSYELEVGNMQYIVSSYFNTQGGKTLRQILSELIAEKTLKTTGLKHDI